MGASKCRLTDTNVLALAVCRMNLFAGTGGDVSGATNPGVLRPATTAAVGSGQFRIDAHELSIAGSCICRLRYKPLCGHRRRHISHNQCRCNLDGDWSKLSIQRSCGFRTTLFAGSWYSGIYRSTNVGANWIQINAGLTDAHAISLVTWPRIYMLALCTVAFVVPRTMGQAGQQSTRVW